MKNRFTLTLVFVVALFVTANAQFKPFNFGFKVAPHIGWMKPDVDKYNNDGLKLGFGWGFIGEFNFSENYSVSTGFNMLFNGGKLKFPGKLGADTGTFVRSYNLKYIELPIMLKMRTNDINGLKYFGQIGLGTAFSTGAKAKDSFTYGNTTSTSEKYKYEKTAFLRESLLLGAGVEYTLEAGTVLGGGLSFNNGFTDVLTGVNSKDNSQKEKAVPNFIEVNVFVLF